MSPVISRYTIKLAPIEDVLELCADAFDQMVDLAVQHQVNHTDWTSEAEQLPCEIAVTIVTYAEKIGLGDISGWLHDNHGRGGTLVELCTWRLQHRERANRFGDVLAPGTIFQDGQPPRPPMSFMPYAHRWGQVPRLSIRPYGSSWRADTSFIAVLDSDNPSSS